MENIDLKKKLDEVFLILQELSRQYDFDFSLNYISEETGNVFQYNSDIDVKSLDCFMSYLNELKNSLAYQDNLLAEGYILAMCQDDEEKPEGYKGKWLHNGRIYLVEAIYPTKNNRFVCSLFDLEDHEMLHCLCNLDRFELLSLPSTLN